MAFVNKIEANGTVYDIKPTDDIYYYKLPQTAKPENILFPTGQLATGVTITERARAFYQNVESVSFRLWVDIDVQNASTNPWMDSVQSYQLYKSENHAEGPMYGVIWHPTTEFEGTNDKNLVEIWLTGLDAPQFYTGTIHIDPRRAKTKVTSNVFTFQITLDILWLAIYDSYVPILNHAGDDAI